MIYKSFGKTVDEFFTLFDDTPVAAASIAQVHKAQFGEFLAVKILTPGIQKKYNQDIKLLYFLAKCSKKAFKKVKRLKLTEVIDLLKFTMHQELDLRLEAATASEMSDNF